MRSIVSNFYLHRRRTAKQLKLEDWQRFARNGIRYWNRFIDKWVLNYPSDAAKPLYCNYESLLADPRARSREVLLYMSIDALDEDRLNSALEAVSIRARDRLSSFEYFDPAFFRSLEKAADPRLNQLKLPSFLSEI